MEDLFRSRLANVPEAVGMMGETGRREGRRGAEGEREVETGHSCLPRSRHWSWASADKDLGVLVLMSCPYAFSFSLSPVCVCMPGRPYNVSAC